MIEEWDAVVIGAGPAGAVTARELARRGNRVLLVDRAAFPRNKVCGCCLNGAALAALRGLGLGHVAEPGVPLIDLKLAAGASSATLKMTEGIALSRAVLDQALVDEAVKCGATFLDNTTAKLQQESGGRQPPDGHAVTLTMHQGTHVPLSPAAKLVILAAGLTAGESQVQPGSRIGGGVMVPAEVAPDFYTPGRLFMAAGRGGYVGLVRLADGSLDVAAAFDSDFVRNSGGLAPSADAILSRTGWPLWEPDAQARALIWKGTPALTRRRMVVAEHRLFAVGDATGYVEPFTGEGMAWAISSAAALAPIAHRAIAEWNDDCIAEWRHTHARIVARRQWLCRAAARVLRSPTLTGLAVRALSFAPALARPVVAALNRPARLHGQLA